MTGRQIQLAVNEILHGLNHEDFIGDSINWFDLRCVDVYGRISLINDDVELHALIEEAAPEAVKLQLEIQKQMLIKHYVTIWVETEW